MLVGLGASAFEDDILFAKDGLDQIGRAREPLAKAAMADRDAQWISERRVADVATQTSPPPIRSSFPVPMAARRREVPREPKSHSRKHCISWRGGPALNLTRK